MAWGLGYGARSFELLHLAFADISIEDSPSGRVFIVTPRRKTTKSVAPI